ncbi:hypothetical protein [Methanolacinia petrolearia]|uniref:hypothetical protein n=1 Tax=Methanolacinia petrolearia TaxID=54120 RepID=UPI003BA88B11
MCGFFSVLLFIGYFALITFGESAWLNIILIAGIAGLIAGALIAVAGPMTNIVLAIHM